MDISRVKQTRHEMFALGFRGVGLQMDIWLQSKVSWKVSKRTFPKKCQIRLLNGTHLRG